MKEEKYAKKIKSNEKSNETKKSNPAKETKKSSSKKVTENKSVERATLASEQVVKPDSQKQQSSKSPTYNAATMLQNANKEMLAKKRRRNTAIGVTAGILLATAIIVPAVYLNGKVDINVSVPALQQDESFSVVVKRGFKVGDLQPKEIEGYTFEGFYKDANLTERYSDDDKITKDITIYAKYTANVYAITFPSSPYFTIAGEDIENNKAYAEYDSNYSFRVNLSAGYTESDIHVYLGETELIPVDGVYTITIKGDSTINITGVEINTYSVVYYDEDAETIIHSEEVDYNTASTYTDTPEKPADNTYTYTFSGWVYYESGEPITDELTHVINNIKVKASYTATYIEYSIDNIPTQVTIQKGSQMLTSSDTLHYGDTVDISYTPTTGYDMTSFKVSGATLVSGDTYRITGNLTVTYTETIQIYTITIESNNTSYGTVDESTLSIPYGTTYQVEGNDLVFSNGARVTPTPASSDAQYSYTFTGWSETSGTITGEETLTAIFTRAYVEYSIENPYTQVTILHDGSPVNDGETLHYGDTVEITYTPTEGYEMTTFTVTGADRVGETDTYTVTGNLEITYAEEQNISTLADFTISDGIVMAYTGTASIVEIPSSYSISDDSGLVIEGTDYTVTGIGASAFSGNTSITSITIPESVTSIGNRAFYNCTGLTEINFNATNIPNLSSNNYVFYNAGKNSIGIAVNIGTNVTRIPAYLFSPRTNSSYSPNIVTVNFAEGSQCKEIGAYAFDYCNSLINISIPSGVTSIGYDAFYNCSSLTNITIPSSVTSIGSYAFYRCSSLADVYYAGDINDWVSISFGDGYANPLSYGANLYLNGDTTTPVSGEINIDTATSIGKNSFSLWTRLTNVTIGDQVTSIGDRAFYECGSLTDVYYGGDINDWVSISFGDGYANPLSNGANLYLNGDTITPVTEINIDRAISIGAYSFYGLDGLTKVTIGDQVTSIGNDAFYRCSGLTDVYYGGDINEWVAISIVYSTANPLYYAENLYLNGDTTTPVTEINIDTATSIGVYSLYGWDGLTKITIGDQVTSIGIYAFSNCTGLTEINFNATNMSNLSSSNHVFSYAGNDSTGIVVNIGANVTRIPAYLFNPRTGSSYSPNIMSVNFEENSQCTEIGEYAFSYCDSLSAVTFGENSQLESIGEYAFGSCHSLVEILNKSSLTFNVGDYGTSTSINPILEIITEESETKLINIDGNLYKDYNGERYFIKNIDGSTEITIDPSATQIYQYAFSNRSDITSVIIPSGVTSIGTYAFSGCSSLTSITIPSSVTSIGQFAFLNCTALESVTFENTSGWYRTTSSTATSGTRLTLTNAETNATYLTDTYDYYYWKRNA